MRYFHRTSVPPDRVLAEAEQFFGTLELTEEGSRVRRFTGSIGTLSISIRPEGGHYVHVTVETDQLGESELDKLAKRFLGVVHKAAHPAHEVHGAY